MILNFLSSWSYIPSPEIHTRTTMPHYMTPLYAVLGMNTSSHARKALYQLSYILSPRIPNCKKINNKLVFSWISNNLDPQKLEKGKQHIEPSLWNQIKFLCNTFRQNQAIKRRVFRRLYLGHGETKATEGCLRINREPLQMPAAVPLNNTGRKYS